MSGNESVRFFFYSLSPLIFLGLAIVVAIVMHAPLPASSEFAIYSGLPPLGLPAHRQQSRPA